MRLKVGLVGVGFMGWIHYLAWKKVAGAELSAFVSRDPSKRKGDWTGIKGNFGPPGEQVDVTVFRAFATLEELLADPSIDLVDICSPPHAHVDTVRAALSAGKHVLCEKPLALNAGDSQQLVQAASRAGKKLMVAHVLPFMPEFTFLVDAYRTGRFGKLITGRFRRVIGPPDWIPDFYDAARIGGPLIDLHVHDAHLIRLLFGQPSQVTTRARMKGNVPQFVETLLDFEDGRFAAATCGVTDSPGRPFCHGYEVQFERATLQFEFVALSDGAEVLPLKVLHADGRIERPVLSSGDPIDAFTAELQAAAAMACGEHDEPILDGSLAADAISICQAQARSALSGKSERLFEKQSEQPPRPWILAESDYGSIKHANIQVAVLPFGATEPHNLHLPYGTDVYEATILGEQLCEAAFQRGAKITLLPTIPFGVQTNMRELPLAININPSTLNLFVTDIVRSLRNNGIEKIVLLNSHGGNDFKPLLRELAGDGIQLFCIDWFRVLSDVYHTIFTHPEDHAGEMETSFALAYFPNLVRHNPDGTMTADDGTIAKTRFEAVNSGWVSITRPWHLLTTNCGSGNPHAATAEKGRRCMEILVDRLSSFLVELSGSVIDKRFPY